MSYTLKARVEFETSVDLAAPLACGDAPRWQRKQIAAAAAAAASSSCSVPSTPARAGLLDAARTPCAGGGTPSKTPRAGDRFIPARESMNLEVSRMIAAGDENAKAAGADEDDNGGDKAFRARLASVLLPGAEASAEAPHRVLAFRSKAPAPAEEHVNSLSVLYTAAAAVGCARGAAVTARYVPSAPERILDAPGLVDDYYLNLLDWSASNVLAVALEKTVYCWNGANGSTSALCTLPDESDQVTSVAWASEGSAYLALGTSSADVQLWDAGAGKQVRRLRSHAGRVGSLAWHGHVLSSGSRDGYIHNYDVRVRNAHVATLAGHTGEVCGLKYNAEGLLASGGNDNKLCIWDLGASAAGAAGDITRDVAPVFTLTEHVAAVKALAWCPWQRNTVASGGGSADRCIKFWNAGTGACMSSIDTGSQVCANTVAECCLIISESI